MGSDIMQFLLLSLFLSLPLSSALSGSHVSVTMGGSSYSHGDIMDFNHAAPTFSAVSTYDSSASAASASAASAAPAPTSSTASAPSHVAPTLSTPSAPVYYSPSSSSYSPSPVSYALPPVRYLPNPVVVTKP